MEPRQVEDNQRGDALQVSFSRLETLSPFEG